MPPKKVPQKGQSLEKQTKLFSKEEVKEPSKVKKTKSKQFDVEGDLDKVESVNHTNLWEYGSGVTPKKLLLSSWNVNGIRAVLNRNDLQKYIEKVKPDIFCLN